MRKFTLLLILLPLSVSAHNLNLNTKDLYLGGSIQILNDGYEPNESKIVVLETDGISDAINKEELSDRLTYKNGESLRTVLSEPVFNELERFLVERDIEIDSVNKFKPQMVVLSLLVNELTSLKLSAPSGVDLFFNRHLIKDSSTETQMAFIENMGNGHHDEMILSALSDLRLLSSETEHLLTPNLACVADSSFFRIG